MAGSTDAWVTTDGLQSRLNTLVTAAVSTIQSRSTRTASRRIPVIGFASLARAAGAQLLQDTSLDDVEYSPASEGHASTPLASHHQHFFVVRDPPTQAGAGAATQANAGATTQANVTAAYQTNAGAATQADAGAAVLCRRQFERQLKHTVFRGTAARHRMFRAPANVGAALLVVEGGPETLDTVEWALGTRVPVVVLEGSGGVADLLAFGWRLLHDTRWVGRRVTVPMACAGCVW